METLGGLGGDCLHVGLPAQVIRQGGAQCLGGFDDLNRIVVDDDRRQIFWLSLKIDPHLLRLGWIDLHPICGAPLAHVGPLRVRKSKIRGSLGQFLSDFNPTKITFQSFIGDPAGALFVLLLPYFKTRLLTRNTTFFSWP